MSRKVLEEALEKLIAATARALEPHDFERRGKVLKAISNGMAGIIEFQKSDKSSDRQIIFTINMGVVCGDLLDDQRTDINRSTVIDAQLRTRLGALLEPPSDAWWELSASTDCETLAKELSGLLVSKAVPYLQRHMNVDALVALWESGRSPGLTAVQRARFLSELKSKLR